MPNTSILFEQNPNPMFVFDMETLQIEEVNKSAITKYGYTEEEFRGLTLRDIRPQEEVPTMKEVFKELSQRRDPQVIGTHQHLTKDGVRFHAKITTQPVPGTDGGRQVAHVVDVTELVEVKQDYREACTELRNHIDANPLAFIKFDSKFRIVHWSKGAEHISGFCEQEMIGKNPLETNFILDSEKARVADRMDNFFTGEVDSDPFETVVKTRDGDQIDVRFHTSILHNPDGALKSIVTFLENISDEKEYQQKLEEEQQRMERAQNLAKLGWWSYEVKEDRVIWSDVLYDILDVNKEDFKATFEAFDTMVHPDDRPKLQNVMDKAQQTRDPIDYKLRLKGDNREITYVQCRAQGKFNNRGDLVELSGVLQDITEKVRAKERIERNKQLFERLFLDSPVAMAMMNKDKKVQMVNDSFVDLFGYEKEEIVGKDLLVHLLPKDRYDKIPLLYGNAFSGRKRYYEDVRVTKDGEKINLFVGALPVSLKGEVIAVYGIYVDVTKLKLTESQLKESLQEKEVLLAEIHHRVKNNLAVISGLLELEGMNWDDESPVNKVMKQSKLRIQSMAKIHEKLYQSGNFADLNLENYVTELVEAIFETMQGQKKEVVYSIESDHITLNINQAISCALLINELVTNAFKYAFAGKGTGQLDVKLKKESRTVTISVADNGRV